MNIWQKFSTPKAFKISFGGKITFLLIGLILSIIGSLSFGSVMLNFAEILNGEGSTDINILLHLRIPRVFAAVLAGAALAVSGVIIQAVLNNPLASPNVVGVNSGAGLGAVIILCIFPSAASLLPFAAFLGALFACMLIFAISRKSGADRISIALIGIAVSSIFSGAVNLIKSLFPNSAYDTAMFSIGGFSGVNTDILPFEAVVIITTIIIAALFSSHLDILSLGDESAHSLGLNVKATKLIMLLLAAILASAAVSFAGLIGFVGLLVPHIARKFVGSIHKRLIPASAIMGAILVTLCDLLGRTLFSPYEISVGIILSLIGGPFFIILILIQKGRGFYDRT